MAWNGSDGKKTNDTLAAKRPVDGARGRPSWPRGAFAALAVVIGGVMAFWFIVGRDTSHAGKPSRPETPESQVSGRHQSSQPRISEEGITVIPQKAVAGDEAPSQIEKAKEEAVAAEEARIKKWKDKFAKHRSLFTNGSDQILGMIASAPPGRDMPPMPITKSIDRDFEKSLESPIVINSDDTDEVKALKQSVMDLRMEVLAIKEAEGLTVYQILTEHQDLMRENAKLRAEAQKEAREIYESGDIEGAREYVDKMNEQLDKLGSEQIKMPGEQNHALRQHIRDRLEAIRNKNTNSTRDN